MMVQTPEREVLILYGTQTGTAQEVSEEIWRKLKKYWIPTSIMSFEHYPIVRFFNKN